MSKLSTIALLGAGSWGTAIALHLAHMGHQVFLWGHNPQHIERMIQEQANPNYLPHVYFPQNLLPTSDLNLCLKQAEEVFVAVPSHAFRELLNNMPSPPSQGLTWLTKGVDPISHQLLSELVFQYYGMHYPVAILSGPSFAKEVAQFLPTALTCASNNVAFQKKIHELVHYKNMRVYLSNDLIGVQWCGAVKNILAIACGISDGLGYGSNAKAALITRGLAEMSRVGIKLGAKQETFLGLAGVGDLVLTCTDDKSRNRRFGLLLGHGLSIRDAEKEVNQVVEGKHNAPQICKIASTYQVEMPICEQINALLENKITPKQAVNNLMSRPAKGE